MGVLKKLIFRMKKVTVAYLTLSTTSVSATWSPLTVTNSGATLTWDVTGDITPTSQNVDDPTFDLSANLGTVDMNVYDVGKLEDFGCQSSNVTLLNVDSAVELIYLYCYSNQLTSINTNNNPLLQIIACQSNQIASLDLSNNPNITSAQVYDNNMLPSATDQIYIDLANGVGINGQLFIRNNRTSASDSARATLVSRGWSFTEVYGS